jgi:hypothetical protein
VRNAGPAGATLDLNFMFPGSMPPGITFTRASTATYTDASGVIQTAAVNVPRWDYAGGALRGLLIEEARTNLLLNSATLSTQSVTVTAQAYTLSFYGTGTVTKSGAATGALVGTGAGQRVTQTFTPTAGTLTCTVTGSVANAQIEAGAFATSYIPTTSAAVTRAQDVATMPTGTWFNASAGSLLAEFLAFNPGVAGHAGIVRMDDTTDTNFSQMFLAPGNAYFYSRVAGVDVFLTDSGVVAIGTAGRIATCYGGASWRGAYRGVIYPGPGTALPFAANRLILGSDNVDLNIYKLNGYLRRVQYWPRALSDIEMQQVTA